jgi:hypothetical protein
VSIGVGFLWKANVAARSAESSVLRTPSEVPPAARSPSSDLPVFVPRHTKTSKPKATVAFANEHPSARATRSSAEVSAKRKDLSASKSPAQRSTVMVELVSRRLSNQVAKDVSPAPMVEEDRNEEEESSENGEMEEPESEEHATVPPPRRVAEKAAPKKTKTKQAAKPPPLEAILSLKPAATVSVTHLHPTQSTQSQGDPIAQFSSPARSTASKDKGSQDKQVAVNHQSPVAQRKTVTRIIDGEEVLVLWTESMDEEDEGQGVQDEMMLDMAMDEGPVLDDDDVELLISTTVRKLLIAGTRSYA